QDAVTDDLQHIEMKQVGDVLLVRLQLIPSSPDVRVFIARILQFDDNEWQAVNEQHYVRPARELRALDAELVDRKPVVRSDIGEVEQSHAVAAGLAVFLKL